MILIYKYGTQFRFFLRTNIQNLKNCYVNPSAPKADKVYRYYNGYMYEYAPSGINCLLIENYKKLLKLHGNN